MKPLFLILFFAWQTVAAQQKILLTKEGTIHFKSEAPLELIEATSKKMKGALNPAEQTFAFSVANNSFEGFNSALQREHFNENYMESVKFPTCTFSGKIRSEERRVGKECRTW